MIYFCFSVVIVFNIHINKLFFISLSPKVSSYADDTQIFSIGHSCPIHSKGVESSLCIDNSSWRKSCRKIYEVIPYRRLANPAGSQTTVTGNGHTA